MGLGVVAARLKTQPTTDASCVPRPAPCLSFPTLTRQPMPKLAPAAMGLGELSLSRGDCTRVPDPFQPQHKLLLTPPPHN